MRIIVLTFIFLVLAIIFCDAQRNENEEEEEEDDEENQHPLGHMMPLGTSGDFWKVEETSEFPDPVDFFDKYVKPSRPVVFRGMAKQFPSFENFKNDQYLKSKYGKWKIFYEYNKKEDSEHNGKRASLKNFLDLYNKKPVYLISDTIRPTPLTKEIFLPKPVLCDEILKRFETCILWISSGGSKSTFHADSFENIHCVYDGTKQFVMAHKNHAETIRAATDGVFASLDVDKVDFNRFPTLAKTSWYKAKVEAGDCLYIPFHWLHQVRSDKGRNLAINYWWSQLLVIPNVDECRKQSKELEGKATVYDYPRRNESERQRSLFISNFEKEKGPITLDRFHDIIATEQGLTPLNETKQVFSKIDKDNDNLISIRDMYLTDLEVFKPVIKISAKEPDDNNETYKYEEVDSKDEL